MAHQIARVDLPRLEELKQRHKPLRNVAIERRQRLSSTEQLALVVTKRVGTLGFFFLIAGWTIVWLSWNIFMPKAYRFDPPPGFVLWLFISNMIQILLMPLLMVGQNVLSLDSELRAESDYEVNLKTEHYVETILLRLEHQEQLLHQLLERMGTSSAEEVSSQ